MKRTTKTNDGITAIYVRRSVSDKDKGNNSLSIFAQKEECIRFVGECDYRIYCDAFTTDRIQTNKRSTAEKYAELRHFR